MKPILTALLLALALLPSRATAESAYAIADHTTGFILESAGGTKKLQIGSLAKIATAMVVLDWSEARGQDLGQMAVVPVSAANLATPSGIGFQPGDRCSLRELLYAAMMQSDNQAAETLAEHVGRALGNGELAPVDEFVKQMNALARKLGMERTRFLNAHGLDTLERSLPYSTAEDLAKLTSYAMTNSAFRFYVSQKERKIAYESATGEPAAYLLRNTNQLVGVNDIDGVKTGTTRRAGQCLIVSAMRPPDSRQQGDKHIITPRRLNVIVLGSDDRFNETTALLRRGWQLYDAWSAAGRPTKGRRGGR
jgi:serine-type D-Ala-D-Ala carboxypeptidase (penicillin-binding protein 5/6)